MSGGAGPGGGGDHGRGRLYGDRHPLASFDRAGSTFFQDPACSAGGDAADAGLTPYSSLTDYLQGFLDPAGLARHLDAPTGDPINRASAAPVVTPNSPTSSEQRLSQTGTPAAEVEDEEAGSADHQNCRSGTPEKKKEKKARGSRVAFATKSEVDHLDDGYRWRKYGQKAVKNSSFPRSYYRCTTARCGVKKQVERSQQDPSTVVTTYEGQHAHPSPAAHRSMANSLYSLASFEPSHDDLLHEAACAMAPAAAANALSAALLPRPVESRFAEYYGVQLHDVLLSGNQYGHR